MVNPSLKSFKTLISDKKKRQKINNRENKRIFIKLLIIRYLDVNIFLRRMTEIKVKVSKYSPSLFVKYRVCILNSKAFKLNGCRTQFYLLIISKK